jgi:hypothetical protein
MRDNFFSKCCFALVTYTQISEHLTIASTFYVVVFAWCTFFYSWSTGRTNKFNACKRK